MSNALEKVQNSVAFLSGRRSFKGHMSFTLPKSPSRRGGSRLFEITPM